MIDIRKSMLTMGSIICLFVLVSLSYQPIIAVEPNNSNDFYWGVIFDKRLETVLYTWINHINDSWDVVFDFSYYLFGIGRHDINVEFSYNVTFLDADTNETKQKTGVISFNDELYFFQPSKTPIMKIRTSGSDISEVFWYYLEGSWTGIIEVNGENIYEFDWYWEWDG